MAQSSIRYLEMNGEDASNLVYTAESRAKITKPYPVDLYDGRTEVGKYRDATDQLNHQGFAFIQDFKSKVEDVLEKVENPRMYSKDGKKSEGSESINIRDIYYKECEDLVKDLTGADVVFALTHGVRNMNTNNAGAKARKDQTKGSEFVTAYATFAHTDYSEEILDKSWKMLVKRGVPKEQAMKMETAFFNVWQPTSVPVEMAPLAVLDWQSVDPAELHKVQLGYALTPRSDRNSESYAPPIVQPTYNKSHKWYIYPNMQPDEAIVFTQVDARPGRPTHSFHTAVKHQIKDNPVPRQSIEVRVVCGFLPKEADATRSNL